MERKWTVWRSVADAPAPRLAQKSDRFKFLPLSTAIIGPAEMIFPICLSLSHYLLNFLFNSKKYTLRVRGVPIKTNKLHYSSDISLAKKKIFSLSYAVCKEERTQVCR